MGSSVHDPIPSNPGGAAPAPDRHIQSVVADQSSSFSDGYESPCVLSYLVLLSFISVSFDESCVALVCFF